MLRSRLNHAMSKPIRNHIRSNLIGYIALFFALSTGSAVALNGSNSVQSDDLGPGAQVKAPDIADNAVNSADVQNFSLGNGDFLAGSVDSRVATDSSLTGADVSLNSLTGSDINESTLSGVKDGDSCISGAARFGRLCAGSDGVNRTLFAAFNFCASIDLRLPTWGEAVLLAVNHDVPGVGASPARFWTDEIDFVSSPRYAVMTVEENGAGDPRFDNATFETVCVTNPD
jgi:hypothetical protein